MYTLVVSTQEEKTRHCYVSTYENPEKPFEYDLLLLILDYKDGNISSDFSGLETAFPPLNQTFVVT